MAHLWEVKHPYSCSGEFDETYDSFAEFLEAFDHMDKDLNLVFRFDWHDSQDEKDDYDIEQDELLIYTALQRKGYMGCSRIKVVKEDEPKVIEWLKTRLAYYMQLWEPIKLD